MELNDWLAIIGAFGGLEAVRWGVTFWVNRKTNARKEDTPLPERCKCRSARSRAA